MATSRNNDVTRYRYGKCLNENCDRSHDKQPMQIPARKEFKCPDCGQDLYETPPPKAPKKILPWIIGAVVIGCIIAAIIIWAPRGNKEEATDNDMLQENVEDSLEPIGVEEEAPLESITAVEPQPAEPEPEVAVQETKPAPTPAPAPQPTSGSVTNKDLGYGTYTGGWKNGKPHGEGTLVYKQTTQINPYDMKKRMAQPGEKIQGQFVNGVPTIVQHFDSNGAFIERMNMATAN